MRKTTCFTTSVGGITLEVGKAVSRKTGGLRMVKREFTRGSLAAT